MRRRDLLQALLLAGVGASPSLAGERWARAVTPVPGEADVAGSAAGDRPLSEAERKTLLAFAEVLVGGRPLSPPERGELLSHITDRARTSAGLLSLYRRAAMLLDRLAGAPFSTLEIRERLALVTRHRLMPSRGRVEPPDAAAHAVRTRVAPDLIAGYYASPMGWAAVGYTVFPSRCGDLVRYTRPEP